MTMFTKAEIKMIDDAESLMRCALVASAPSTSRMGAGLLHDQAAVEAIDRAAERSPALAIIGLRWLAVLRRADAYRERQAALSAPITKAWGSITDEMVARFEALRAESWAKAGMYWDLAERLARTV